LAKEDTAPTPATLAAITAAAQRCLRFDEIGGALGLTLDEWRALVRSDPDAVALAIAQGRTVALAVNAQALQRCVRHGKAEAALFILRRDHGWPARGPGRPRRQEQR
jgi:hypothetical protein